MQKYREQLTFIDKQIIELLDARFALVQKVKAYKHLHNIPIYQPQREQEIFALIKHMAKYNPQIQEIYQKILTKSKELQR